MDINFTFRIPNELLAKVKEQAEESYLSTSDIIRQAIIKYLKENERNDK